MKSSAWKVSVCGFGIVVALAFGMLIQPARQVSAQIATPIPTVVSNTTIAVQVPTTPVKVGDEFEVPVTLTTDVATWGAQFQLTFDPALIEVSKIDEGTFYKEWASAHGASGLMMPNPAADNDKGMLNRPAFFVAGAHPGEGPTGSGNLAVLHLKAKKNGTAELKLSEIEIDDAGVNDGNTTMLGGVKIQDGVIAIGGDTAAQQPDVAANVEPTLPPASMQSNDQPTVVRRATPAPESSGGQTSIPWEIVLSIAGALGIGAVAFVFLRKR
jgi:hypothetical protein